MKVEKAMFETASSRDEYYQLLAEKIFRIRKEREERRKNKLEMDKWMPGLWFTVSASVVLGIVSITDSVYMYCIHWILIFGPLRRGRYWHCL